MTLQCLDCGAANPDGKRFCGDCGAPLDGETATIKRYLAANLPREIRTALKDELRDQKVVEVEMTEAVVEKLTSWAKVFGFFVGIPIAIAIGVLGILGLNSYENFSKLVHDATASLTATLQRAQTQADSLKQQADQVDAEYKNLQARLQDTTALAAQVGVLSDKVNSIEEKIGISPSAHATPQLERIVVELRSFQSYLLKVGFKIANSNPMLVDTKEQFPSGAVAEFDPGTNTMLLKSDHISDVTLALSVYADHAVTGQDNLKNARYDYSGSIQYYAATWGIRAYLTCSFMNDPNFTARGVNLSAPMQKFATIRYAEDGAVVWGGLFWDIRKLLPASEADALIASVWRAVTLPPNANDFPKVFVRLLLDKYGATASGKDPDRLLVILRARGFDS
jgi:hypothetical protein